MVILALGIVSSSSNFVVLSLNFHLCIILHNLLLSCLLRFMTILNYYLLSLYLFYLEFGLYDWSSLVFNSNYYFVMILDSLKCHLWYDCILHLWLLDQLLFFSILCCWYKVSMPLLIILHFRAINPTQRVLLLRHNNSFRNFMLNPSFCSIGSL